MTPLPGSYEAPYNIMVHHYENGWITTTLTAGDSIEFLYESIICRNYPDPIPNNEIYNLYSGVNNGPWAYKNYSIFAGNQIDQDANQAWYDDTIDKHYYYPVLPKLTSKGNFDEQQSDGSWEFNLGLLHYPNTEYTSVGEESRPFGSDRLWDGDDSAYVTSLINGKWINYCLIDVDFSKIEDGALEDSGPLTNYGILIDDYKLNYQDDPLEVNVTNPTIRTKLGKQDKGKAY